MIIIYRSGSKDRIRLPKQTSKISFIIFFSVLTKKIVRYPYLLCDYVSMASRIPTREFLIKGKYLTEVSVGMVIKEHPYFPELNLLRSKFLKQANLSSKDA